MELNHSFYLSIGSNLGDKLRYLRESIRDLTEIPCEIKSVSSIYETPAIGIDDAPNFFNACVFGKTDLEAPDFMTELLKIEKKHGRTRDGNHVSARTLDLDIILFDHCIIDTPLTKIPHPRYTERKFVLIPLLEIDPNIVDPRELKPIHEYLHNSTDESVVKKLEISLFA